MITEIMCKTRVRMKAGVLFLLMVCLIIVSCEAKRSSLHPDLLLPGIPVKSKETVQPTFKGSLDCSKQNEQLSELEKLFHEKKYKDAIYQSGTIIKKPCSAYHTQRAFEILGDIYAALEEYEDAVYFYLTAAESADDSWKRDIITKAVSMLSTMDTGKAVELLLDVEKKTAFGSELLYRTGMRRFHLGQEKQALALFKAYQENFPDRDTEKQSSIRKTVRIIQARHAFLRDRIGILMPLSGPNEKYGNRALSAVKMAIDDFNIRHDGMRFSAIPLDTQGELHIAASAVKQLEMSRVAGIIGPLIAVEQAARIANELKVPIIVLSQKEKIAAIGTYVFRHFITPEMQAESLLAYAMGELGMNRFAVLYPDDRYGRVYEKAFSEITAQFGGEIKHSLSYQTGQTDFGPQIASLIKGYHEKNENGAWVPVSTGERKKRHGNYKAIIDFDALFIPDTAFTTSLIAPQLRFHDIDNVLLMGTNIWQYGQLEKIGGRYVEGAIFPVDFDATIRNRKARDFILKFEDKWDEPPGFIEAAAYDACMMMLTVLSRSGVRSREELMLGLKSIKKFEGVTGRAFFDPFGEAIKKLDLYQIHGDQVLMLSIHEAGNN